MRAKTINEDNSFERGHDPKKSIGIGKVKEAYDKMQEWLAGSSKRQKRYGDAGFYKITANSVNDIRVELNDRVKEAWSIYEQKEGWHSDPDFIKVRKDWVFDIEQKEGTKEIAQAALEGLNSKFGNMWAFELIDKKVEN